MGLLKVFIRGFFASYFSLLLGFSQPPLTDFIKVFQYPNDLIKYLYSHRQINASTLILFDIDDTLLVSQKECLRASAIDHLINQIIKKMRCEKPQALSFIDYCLWRKGDHLGAGGLVSKKYKELFQNLKSKKARLIALTQVAPGNVSFNVPSLKINFQLPITYEERRYEDLKKNGIQFEDSFFREFSEKKLTLGKGTHVLKGKKSSQPVFMKGILLTGSLSKGQALSLFLERVKWKPKNIIFIDNNLHHLRSVQENAQALGIKYEGLHLTYVNQISESFSPKCVQRIAFYLCRYGTWP